ncbi:MAG: peptidylprolyl isomerase [Pseudomonadota bacterium]
MLKALLTAPLFQFLLIGAVITLIWSTLQDEGITAREPIVIGEARMAELVAGFGQLRQRPPTPQELTDLIEAAIREEVLYREALKRGLAQGDAIVRQRLAQKMEFALVPPAPADPPEEAVLQRYLNTHNERYQRPPEVALRQLYLSRDERGAALEEDAVAILAALEAGADPAALGDPILLPRRLTRTSVANVRRVFGPEFAQAVLLAPVGEWSGPVQSAYGLHLVRIDEKTPPADPALDDIRDAVIRDYQADQRRAVLEGAYADLESGYDITIDYGDTNSAVDTTSDDQAPPEESRPAERGGAAE